MKVRISRNFWLVEYQDNLALSLGYFILENGSTAITRVCSMGSHDDADGVVVELEEMLGMIDQFLSFSQDFELKKISRRLLGLGHWIQGNLPTCTSLATGVEGGQIAGMSEHPGRPKKFINFNMVEILRGMGYT